MKSFNDMFYERLDSFLCTVQINENDYRAIQTDARAELLERIKELELLKHQLERQIQNQRNRNKNSKRDHISHEPNHAR